MPIAISTRMSHAVKYSRRKTYTRPYCKWTRITCCQTRLYSAVRVALMCVIRCPQQPRHRVREAGKRSVARWCSCAETATTEDPRQHTTSRDELPRQDNDELWPSSISTHIQQNTTRIPKTQFGRLPFATGWAQQLQHWACCWTADRRLMLFSLFCPQQLLHWMPARRRVRLAWHLLWCFFIITEAHSI